jgi:DNA-binding MarR family transcriptional regulator
MEPDPIDRALDLYRDTVRALHTHAAPVWRELELSMAQVRALFVLADGGPMPIGQVAVQLGIGVPAASSVVDRLVDQGLALRRGDPRDRRRTLAGPSERGAALAQHLRQGSRDALRGCLERMDRRHLATLVAGLEALAEAAGPEPAAATVARA